ncbi:PREDICTED: uncharacterized protein C11orf96 homolog [Condylura cristata]|uniref:uncharacterized protein C11orf96 homolog n=1 Tax=Condylura cristata TaxID=143302 RepID=UPI0006429394|nr:PREDICTED: uncharacterized protein C11orf96 homolog [Condylura cristata]
MVNKSRRSGRLPAGSEIQSVILLRHQFSSGNRDKSHPGEPGANTDPGTAPTKPRLPCRASGARPSSPAPRPESGCSRLRSPLAGVFAARAAPRRPLLSLQPPPADPARKMTRSRAPPESPAAEPPAGIAAPRGGYADSAGQPGERAGAAACGNPLNPVAAEAAEMLVRAARPTASSTFSGYRAPRPVRVSPNFPRLQQCRAEGARACARVHDSAGFTGRRGFAPGACAFTT